MQKTEELTAKIHSFRYHISLYTENIQEFFLKHQEVLTELLEEDADMTIKELSLWCKSVQEIVLLIQFTCKYLQNDFTDQLVKEAISQTANFYDCIYILQANAKDQFLSIQQMEDLFEKADVFAEFTWEYLELVESEQESVLLIYDADKGLNEAIELASNSNDFICLAEHFSRKQKDGAKALAYYKQAINVLEDDDDREDLLKSIGRYCINDKFKQEVYLQLFEQAADKALRLKLFCLLKSKYWEEKEANEKWANFCYKILLSKDWQFLNSICDKYYRKGGKKLRKLIEKTPPTIPSKPLDLLPYAKFMKMLYSNKSKAREYILLAQQLQEVKDDLEPIPFLSIAQTAWRELKDQALTHEILAASELRMEGIEEYCQLLEMLKETSNDKDLMNNFFSSCLQHKYPTYEYYQIAKKAILYLNDKKLANKAIAIALRNADNYFEAMIIRNTIEDYELAKEYLKEAAKQMKNFISNTEEAVDMAQIVRDSFDFDDMDQILELGKNLAKSAKDFSLMIRFVNFWLSNTKRAQYFFQIAFNIASSPTDFERLVVEAKLIYGQEWRRAFT